MRPPRLKPPEADSLREQLTWAQECVELLFKIHLQWTGSSLQELPFMCVSVCTPAHSHNSPCPLGIPTHKCMHANSCGHILCTHLYTTEHMYTHTQNHSLTVQPTHVHTHTHTLILIHNTHSHTLIRTHTLKHTRSLTPPNTCSLHGPVKVSHLKPTPNRLEPGLPKNVLVTHPRAPSCGGVSSGCWGHSY